MCGIVGYLGNSNKIEEVLIDGLKELEYRGYDSSGIALMNNGKLNSYKSVGKIVNLIDKLNLNKPTFITDTTLGIAHTRWATHGKPTEVNAHPHLGEFSYVVHNGIIENYQKIKEELIQDGVVFLSQTDTEVIVHLFEKYFKQTNNTFDSFELTLQKLQGAYAILLISKADENSIYFAKHGSPMILAKQDNEIFFASSDTPLIGHASEVMYLDDGMYGVVNSEIKIFSNKQKANEKFVPLSTNKQSAMKNGFRYYMEKEVYEQGEVVADAILGRVKDDTIEFEELNEKLLESIEEIKICACGTSHNAAHSASYIFERIAKVRTSVEIASEFRYKDPILTNKMLFVVISQSGETADTLEALKMAKKQGLKTLAICNVDNSSIVRLADATILTRAGIEKGVASTKAYATQMIVLWMLALFMGKRNNPKLDIKDDIKAIREIPSLLKIENKLHDKIKRLSKRYLHGHGFFFIGRDLFFPLALEGALKLKEISYLHAEGYPAGEMKHGPIALADAELFTIALLPKNILYDKTKSNIEELIARDTTTLIISSCEHELADDFIQIKEHSHYMGEFFEMMVVLQLLSMEISIRLGNDVDMPRNLAKSVTVE